MDKSKTSHQLTDDDDPYSKLIHDDANKLQAPEKESSRSRKLRLLKSKSKEMYGNFGNGFMIGSLVGGSFGTIIGLYTAIVHRSILLLPISAIMSAASFGFFLGVGSMIRSEENNFDYQNKIFIRRNGVEMTGAEEFWKEKIQSLYKYE